MGISKTCDEKAHYTRKKKSINVSSVNLTKYTRKYGFYHIHLKIFNENLHFCAQWPK